MSIAIPLSTASTAAGARPGIRLALPFGAGAAAASALVVSGPKSDALRAVAVAASVIALERALDVVKQARDDPATPVGNIDKDLLLPVFQAVQRVQEDRTSGPSADDTLAAVARAVGADAALAAAARAALDQGRNPGDKTTPTIDSCLNWVASVNVDLLDRCAQQVRARLIDVFPDQQTRLKRVEDSVVTLTSDIGKLQARVAALEAAVPAPAPGPAPGPGPVPAPSPSPSPSPSPVESKPTGRTPS
ncbi:hypothetical protein [Brevundimonas sp.]|uniref:hypothetical protein n=1 Tax=Brevundimonas sp. TaxID=1871086 RepID=UPI0027308A9B|nr:hypothetical protein [Brevundimonas sp.]MDP1913222.1 hypothetical protein [Brevundimonas sp.]